MPPCCHWSTSLAYSSPANAIHQVFHLYVEENLPFADAYHAVLMRRLGLTEIATFDKHFDRIEGLERTALTSE